MTWSTSAPSRFVRCTSSRAASRARSTARTSFSTVPALQTACDIRRRRPRAVRFHLALHSPFAPGRKLASALRGGELAAETPFSHRTRARALASMAAEPVDLLVIGGGITGAGIARDAALRGLRTALVDKGDFAGATSSRSSRLIHGGLRYLEQYDFHLVREASRERRLLLDLAPHLVRPLAFLFPVYRGARAPAWRLR